MDKGEVVDQMRASPESWPDEVRKYLIGRLGATYKVAPLGGLSLGSVFRVIGGAGSVVVKHSLSPAEYRFYTTHADELRAAGIGIVDVELALNVDGAYWLVLEDLPEQLPIKPSPDWEPDPRVIQTLARLHSATCDWPLDGEPASSWWWTSEMTTSALGVLGRTVDADVETALRQLQAKSTELFAPSCWISGDPNLSNWGVRSDGSVALFDWEHFSPGTPEVDLAIIVPGFLDWHVFERASAAYACEANVKFPVEDSIQTFANRMAVAKTATIVALLDSHACGTACIGTDIIDRLRAMFPVWVLEMSEVIGGRGKA